MYMTLRRLRSAIVRSVFRAKPRLAHTLVSDFLAYADVDFLTDVRHLAVAAHQTRMSEERRMRWPKSLHLNNVACVRALFMSDRSDLGLGGVGVSVEVGSGDSFY